MPRLLVTHSESHPLPIEKIRNELAEFDVSELEMPAGGLQVTSEAKLIEALAGCQVLLLRPGTITAEVIAEATELKVIALMGSGYDHVDVDAATRGGIMVIHTPENPAPYVAEHVFALTFSLLRNLPTTFDLVSEGRWDDARSPVTGLRDCTFGIVGLGTIGFKVAKIARQAFDADVIGYDPYVAGERGSRVYPRQDRSEVESLGVELISDLRTLCDRSDVVSLHVPHTEETDHLISYQELAALGAGHLVNTARGGIVDQRALVTTSRDGRFTGKAALDVLAEEPPNDTPVLDCENVYVTPHIAGVTNRSLDEDIGRTAEKIRTALRGETPDTIVNPDVTDSRVE